MKSLNHKNIIEFIDSSVQSLGGGAAEILICMEYCPGQLIDIMNRRADSRFTENEVLQIFNDVSEAVAYLHYLQPPVIHRDIKVENVLFSGKSRQFKLCDFGSCTKKSYPYGHHYAQAEVDTIEDEIDKRTTLQYRAPEMCDLYRRWGLNEKSDIWALGVLLYKLCYYKTPFEDSKMAILNGRFDIPSRPEYSSDLKQFIKNMLSGNPRDRPNIYRVVETCCIMRQKPCPISNIYPPEEQIPASPTSNNGPPSGGFFAATDSVSPAAVSINAATVPQVAPQRRGRHQQQKSSSSASADNIHSLLLSPQVALAATPVQPSDSKNTNAFRMSSFGSSGTNAISGKDPFSLLDKITTSNTASVSRDKPIVFNQMQLPPLPLMLPHPPQQPRNLLNRPPHHVPNSSLSEEKSERKVNGDPFAQLTMTSSFGKYETLKPLGKPTNQTPSLFQIMNRPPGV